MSEGIHVNPSTTLPRSQTTRMATSALYMALITCTGLAPVDSVRAQSTEGNEDVRAQIQALRAEQARISELQQRTEESIRVLEARLGLPAPTPVVTAVQRTGSLTPDATAATGATLPASSRLKISGDLRLRGQADISDEDGRNRNSSQVRGRLGATFAASDRVVVGGRMVTGDADDPNSTDVQLSNFDDDLDISLDQAYVQLNFGDAKIYGGKMPQPFTRTELVWDGDVSPQGLAATYKRSLAGGGAFRANGLFFVVDEQAAGPDSTMLGAQLGYDSAAMGGWKFDASAGYFDYSLGSVAGADAGDFRSNLRNPDGTYLSDFRLVDVIAGATYQGANEKWPVRAVADVVRNLDAETSADTGYGLDLSVGRISKPGDWRFTYGYAVAETDAVFAAFSQDNLGIATNYQMHALTADYVPMPKTMISAIWYHYKPDQAIDAGSNDPSDWLDRIRLAFLVNF